MPLQYIRFDRYVNVSSFSTISQSRSQPNLGDRGRPHTRQSTHLTMMLKALVLLSLGLASAWTPTARMDTKMARSRRSTQPLMQFPWSKPAEKAGPKAPRGEIKSGIAFKVGAPARTRHGGTSLARVSATRWIEMRLTHAFSAPPLAAVGGAVGGGGACPQAGDRNKLAAAHVHCQGRGLPVLPGSDAQDVCAGRPSGMPAFEPPHQCSCSPLELSVPTAAARRASSLERILVTWRRQVSLRR